MLEMFLIVFLEKSFLLRPDIILMGHVNTIDEEFSKIKNVSKHTIFLNGMKII